MTVDPRAVLTRPAPAPDATVRYGDQPDQIADVRLPARPTGPPRPLVVVVHGGFWRSEYDRTHTGPLAAELAARGYPVAQLEYRRTGQSGGGWPETFADVSAGIAALPAAVGDLLGLAAPARPILLGHSAGGHLALWHASVAPDTVHAVLALAPVADLTEAYRLDLDGGAVTALLGGGPEQVPERYGDADPSRRLPLQLPCVIIHGGRDRQVPVQMSRRYVAAARAAGGEVRLIELPEVEHFAVIDPESPAWAEVTAALHSLHHHHWH